MQNIQNRMNLITKLIEIERENKNNFIKLGYPSFLAKSLNKLNFYHLRQSLLLHGLKDITNDLIKEL